MKKIKDIKQNLDRRSFLQASALAGGGVMIGLYAPSVVGQAPGGARGGPGGAPQAPPALNPSFYITINPDNTFRIVGKNPETGQGIKNALPMLIADEFDVEWSQVRVADADLDPRYATSAGIAAGQIEGGSTAIPQNYTGMRNVGAAMRMMMVSAAAQQWSVAEDQLTTTGNGSVRHAASNRTATYASLAPRLTGATPIAAPAIANVKLKDPKDFKIIGKAVPGVDNIKIVTGQPLYSVDVNAPGMLYAVLEKSGVFGGKPVSANLDEIKKLPGVKHAFLVDRIQIQGQGQGLVPGVAIVADNWWNAQNARKSLKVVWDEGAVATQSSVGYATQAKELSTQSAQPPAGGGPAPAVVGDVDAVFASIAANPASGKVIEAEYMIPLVAHAPLEPQNSTAHFKDGKLEIWSPSQIPGLANAAQGAGIQNNDVTMHLVRAGGGFGRRLASEYDTEVAKIARVVTEERAAAGLPSVPVKLLWSREDDMQHDNYRPGGFHFFKAAVDASGKLVAFRDFLASVASVSPATEFPRGFVPNWSVAPRNVTPFNIPTGALRAPQTNGVSFIMQGFLDEIAVAAGKDPLQYRLDLLNSPVPPPAAAAGAAGGRGGPGGGGGGGGFNAARAIGVLEAVRDMSNWNTARARLPRGTGMGVAFQFAHAGYVAYVVEAAVDANKKIKINRVWSAIDIGSQVVNMSMAKNLVEGGFVEGMSHVMAWEITIDKGRVTQGNFGQYAPARMANIPASIEVKFLQTNFAPTGLGEPSLPPAVPAIVNAIAHATGVRIRSLPLKNAGYSWT
jgi:isoquinoline 1-oxidoreductase beta subunit